MTAAAAAADVPGTSSAKPRVVEGMNVTRLRFKDADGDVVPVLLCVPAGKAGPFPVVVAAHGLTSHKAQVAAQVAPQLTRRGFAVLCPDMPRHGERPGDPRSLIDRGDIAAAFAIGRRAVNDVRQTIDLAEQRPDLDMSHGVYLVGYSLGSWINSVAGAADPRVNAMVLMVGGAIDLPAMALLLPQVAATDPRLALAHFAGRPLLMLNGRHDLTVPADWASGCSPPPRSRSSRSGTTAATTCRPRRTTGRPSGWAGWRSRRRRPPSGPVADRPSFAGASFSRRSTTCACSSLGTLQRCPAVPDRRAGR
jgi:dienelactone hydrolase